MSQWEKGQNSIEGTRSEMWGDGTNEGGKVCASHFLSDGRKRGDSSRQIDEDRRKNRSARLERTRKDAGWLENFEKRQGKNILQGNLTDKIRWDIFVKLSMLPQLPRNVSKISADISDNALSLLKIENYSGKTLTREGQRTGNVRHLIHTIHFLPS